jgi:hypothetical protein
MHFVFPQPGQTRLPSGARKKSQVSSATSDVGTLRIGATWDGKLHSEPPSISNLTSAVLLMVSVTATLQIGPDKSGVGINPGFGEIDNELLRFI